MKINDILECFNKVLDSKDNTNKTHFVGRSYWEREKGPVKTAYTIITKCNRDNSEEVVNNSYTTAIPSGQEDALVEETQRRALVEFIKYWSDAGNTRGL